MGSKPKVKSTAAETPAILTTARDGADAQSASTEATTFGRKKLRIDLNNAQSSSQYGSSLVIPT